MYTANTAVETARADRRRTILGVTMVVAGILTILVTVGTQSTSVSEFFASNSERSDVAQLRQSIGGAEAACHEASILLKSARATSKSNESIFVSMASYRDEQCAPSLLDMYSKAKSPQSIFVGIVEQHDESQGDVECMPKEWLQCQHGAFCPSDNIRIRRILPKDAKGPTYGRYIGALLYGGERFFMQVDSHFRVVTHWDAIAIAMYLRIPYPKPVLSHYPEGWHNPEDKTGVNAPLDNRQTTTYLCKARVLPELGYLRLDGFVVTRRAMARPQPWAAAGFLFAYGRMIEEVPFDPHLDFVFDGEEILYSARMWTHGWNIYSPSENIIYPYYYRTKAKRFWGLLPPDWTSRRDAAQRRIQSFLEIYQYNTTTPIVDPATTEQAVIIERERYGMGRTRSINDWYAYIGNDRKMWTINEEKFCKLHS